MQRSGVLGRTALVFGQMNEPPGARWRVGLTALTIAEYFRDAEAPERAAADGQRVPLRAGGREVSGLLGRLPSRVGYQPTLATEVAALQERIASVAGAAITAIEAVYVPADDFTDPAVTAISSHLDSNIVLSRAMAAEGMYPAIDPLASSSILLDPLVVGAEHFTLAGRAREAIAHYRELADVIALLGVEELGAADRLMVARARKLQRFLTQPFAVTEASPAPPAVRCSWPTPGRLPRHPGWRSGRLARKHTLHARHLRRGAAARQGGDDAPGDHRADPVMVDDADVVSVRAEDASGGFGILPGHADLITALTPSVVAWRRLDGRQHWCAVRRGVLSVRDGSEVTVATRQAECSDDLATLEQAVQARLSETQDAERRARVAATRLHTAAIREIVRALRPDGPGQIGGGT